MDSDVSLLYYLSKFSENDQQCIAYLIKYSYALFEIGAGIPKIQAAWRIPSNLPQ